jgi:broad specificity phosphatase PhoE
MNSSNRQGVRRQRKQAIILLRHGVAVHNVPDARTKQYPDIYDPRLTDPPLIPEGTYQASQASLKIQQYLATASGGRTDVDLVISSPLRRCLQTASLAFPQQTVTATTTAVPPMPSEPSNPSKRRPQMLVNELVREAFGSHYPDKRRNRSDIAAEFPWVRLPEDLASVDPVWRPDARESLLDVRDRIIAFFRWLASNVREDVIGLVSHGVWIETCLMHFCPDVLDNGKKRVYNCDAFRAICLSTWEQSDDGGNNEWKLISVSLEECEPID